MPNNHQNIAVKKWLPVAHSPRDKSHRKKKCDISWGLFAGSSGRSLWCIILDDEKYLPHHGSNMKGNDN